MNENIKNKNKNFWKNGAGEMIGFLCILPFIIFMIALFVSIFHIGTFDERLDYFVYEECRGNIISSYNGDDDFDEFIQKANAKILKDAKKSFKDMSDVTFDDGTAITIEMVDTGTFDQGSFDNKTVTSSRMSSRSSKSSKTIGVTPKKEYWLKGEYVRLTVTATLNAPLAFMGGERSRSIVMMIERPANKGGDYPWFAEM